MPRFTLISLFLLGLLLLAKSHAAPPEAQKNAPLETPVFKIAEHKGLKILVRYNGSDPNVVVPDGVNVIWDTAFQQNRFVKSVKLPESVISIQPQAFQECSALTSVTIPKSVKEIGPMAFSGCESLKSVEIPEGVTAIEDQVFQFC
ncbi:MAG: leucine-rich repeat domain-containing protein, partial [Thermoguttaceae bacterium]|nr:leucine-rich repeat domain-containing protein [Thermoguttaceae bacterium]